LAAFRAEASLHVSLFWRIVESFADLIENVDVADIRASPCFVLRGVAVMLRLWLAVESYISVVSQ
jgi:hypothetical protein